MRQLNEDFINVILNLVNNCQFENFSALTVN